MTNPLGRPTAVYSRRKFAEAVRALKIILRNDKHPAAIRIRCVELLALIYGLEEPSSKRDRTSIRDLVTQHSFEKQLAAQVDKRITDQDAARAQAVQDEAEAATLKNTRAMFDSVLDGDE
jgi:hypothetical protein